MVPRNEMTVLSLDDSLKSEAAYQRNEAHPLPRHGGRQRSHHRNDQYKELLLAELAGEFSLETNR
ncbi:hypothetical protein PO124_27185 [Bacillus licheniformis]|nr:hypothetical protein [Bacillus licheniformis]